MINFHKYNQLIRISWQNGFVYRMNFVMWRIRSVLQLLVVYFLWLAIFKQGGTIAGYDTQAILTYVLLTSLLRSLVLSSRSQDVGAEIATGDLNNILIKPLNYLGSWMAKDLADKALNIVFVIGELILLIAILKPPLILQTNMMIIVTFLISGLLALLMYFFLSFLISSITFWQPEHNGWPARFLSFVVIEFLSGGLFPLDIFPENAARILKLLPPAYFLFHPIQIYLGRSSQIQVFTIIFTQLIWLMFLMLVVNQVWKKGLKVYGAYGR